MASTAEQVYETAMSLPLDEQRRLLDLLTERFSDMEPIHDDERAFDLELRRRLDDIDAGRVQVLSREEAHAVFRS